MHISRARSRDAQQSHRENLSVNDLPSLDGEELIRRVGRDVADSYDEEIELGDGGPASAPRHA
jgi:hypothetical protein